MNERGEREQQCLCVRLLFTRCTDECCCHCKPVAINRNKCMQCVFLRTKICRHNYFANIKFVNKPNAILRDANRTQAQTHFDFSFSLRNLCIFEKLCQSTEFWWSFGHILNQFDGRWNALRLHGTHLMCIWNIFCCVFPVHFIFASVHLVSLVSFHYWLYTNARAKCNFHTWNIHVERSKHSIELCALWRCKSKVSDERKDCAHICICKNSHFDRLWTTAHKMNKRTHTFSDLLLASCILLMFTFCRIWSAIENILIEYWPSSMHICVCARDFHCSNNENKTLDAFLLSLPMATDCFFG